MTEDLPTFKLIAVDDQSEFIFDKTIIAGRNDQCDLVIDLGQASRKHAQLTPSAEGVWVEDLNSTNGTFLNDTPITEPVLAKHRDIIRVDTAAFELIDPNFKEAPPPDDTTVLAEERAREKAEENIEESTKIAKPRVATEDNDQAKNTVADAPLEKPPNASPSSRQILEAPPLEAHAGTSEKNLEPEMAQPDIEQAPPLEIETLDNEPEVPGATEAPVTPHTAAVPDTELAPDSPQELNQPSAVDSHKTDSALPPAWAMNGDQSVDGTQFFPINRIAQAQQRAAENLMQVQEPSLIGKSEDFTTLRYSLAGGNQKQWEIGRAESADIVVNDQSVSNSHAQLIRDGERWKLVDLMSANGTYVNGVKGLATYLQSGNLIRFGQIEFQFLLPPEKKPASEFTATKPSAKNRRRRSNPLLVGACTLGALLVIAAVVYWLG